MQRDILIKWLNWFYTLEMSQVELYLTQARHSNDDYLANVLLTLAATEIRHAESIKEIIIKLDSQVMLIDKLLSQDHRLYPRPGKSLYREIKSLLL